MRCMRIPLLLYIAKNHWQKTLSNARGNTPTTPNELPSSGISASPNRSHRFAAANRATRGREYCYRRPRVALPSAANRQFVHAFQEVLNNDEEMNLQWYGKTNKGGQMITYISKGKFKVVTIKNVQDHHLDTSSCDYVYEIPQGMKEWCSLSVNDRLISLTGNCGRLCIVTEKDLLLNQRVGLLACNDEYIDYAYLLLSSEEYQTLSNNLAKGAAQANLSPVDLCKNIAVLPKLDVLEKFNRQIKPIVASYIQNEIQIAELTKQRDELLPLLMNGQASVNYHLSAC